MRDRKRSYQKPGKGDQIWKWTVIGLTLAGIIIVSSASSDRSAYIYHGNSHAMLLRQTLAMVLGFAAFFVTSRIPYRFWKMIVWPGLIISVVLLLLVLALPEDEARKGAARWLPVGPFHFQPSEMVKYAVVLFIAFYASNYDLANSSMTRGLLIPLGITGMLAGLILLQPDFSTAGLVVIIALIMLFIAGSKPWHLATVVVPVSVFLFLAIRLSRYRWERFTSFYASDLDVYGRGYQLIQSFIGFGRGGLFGVGLGDSKQKLKFLPDAHTDMIFSIVGEELGLIGALILITLFLVLIYRGFRIAVRSNDTFAALLAGGITASIGFYALLNMMIATGAVPTTGLPLPFISYGGTALVITLAASGIVLNISGFMEQPSKKRLGGVRK